jgi:hypothetical protein
MAPRASRVAAAAAGLAAAAGVAWLARHLYEEKRCELSPLSPAEWAKVRSSARERDVVELVRRGGVSPALRAEVWPLLLGLREAAGEEAERNAAAARAALYARLQQRCDAHEAGAADADESYTEARRVIDADVPRTPLPGPLLDATAARACLTRLLRAHALYDPEVGYCQGMSELAAVFLAVFSADEAVAFAAFAAFVARQRRSFLADVAAGVCARLRHLGALLARADPAVGAHLAELRADDCTWALRPMVVLLLRELGADAPQLFDVLLVSPEDFILYVIAAALLSQRRTLLSAAGVDDLLGVIHALPGRLRLGRLLADTRQLRARLKAD